MTTIDLSTAILNVLKSLRKPVEADEIAFRVRSTPSAVKDELDLLSKAQLVKKTNETHYSLARDEERLSSFATAYSGSTSL